MKNTNQGVGDLGQHWTPKQIVEKMISMKRNNGLTLEPSAGSGRFVEALDDCVAIEIDESVIPVELKHKYVVSNFFEVSTFDVRADTIIGNPPYVAGRLLTEEWFAGWRGCLPRTANAYLHFIDKCVDHLEPNGELIFIVPSTMFSDTSRGKELRKRMVETGAFTDAIFLNETLEWENAAVDTLIFRWQKGAKQKKIKTNRGPKTLFESGGFTWLIDYEPSGTLGEWFKATVGSAPLRTAIENPKNGVPYAKEGKFVQVDESQRKKWPRVHDTKEGPKIFFISGPIRRWPVFSYGTTSKHLDHALLPKKSFDAKSVVPVLNEWFQANGEELGLIKGGRWGCGVKQIENCPIDAKLLAALEKAEQ